MKRSFTFMWFLVVALMHVLTPAQAIDPDDQPRMRNAIAHLEAAKTALDSKASLRAARKALVNAKTNKEGERRDAITLVDEAIANVKSGIARAR